MRRSLCCVFLALPVLIVTTVANAQQQAAPSQDPKVSKAIAARAECFEEAQKRHPGYAFASDGLASMRTNAYMDCAKRKGVRP